MAPGVPPPAAMASPLMATLRGEARKTTTSATSAAVTMRPMLLPAPRLASASSSVLPRAAANLAIMAGVRSVAVRPGCTTVTLNAGRPQLVREALGQGRDGDVADRP